MATLNITIKQGSMDKPEDEPDEDLPAYEPDPNDNEDNSDLDSATPDQNQGLVENEAPAPDVRCDRCDGNHESEKCPYYSYTTNQPALDKARHDAWVSKRAKEEPKRERIQKIYYLCGFLLGITGAASLGIMIALAAMLRHILNNDDNFKNSECLQDGQILAEQPSDGEILFILYLWLAIVIIMALLFILRMAMIFDCFDDCLGECFWDGIWKAMIVTGGIFVLAYFASFVVYIRMYIFLDEFVDNSACQEAAGDDFEYGRIGGLYIIPLPCYIIFIICAIIFGVLTCLRKMGKIRIESTD